MKHQFLTDVTTQRALISGNPIRRAAESNRVTFDIVAGWLIFSALSLSIDHGSAMALFRFKL